MTTRSCADCHTNEGVLEVRKRFLCRDCFIRYLSAKVLKRMVSYRFQNLGDYRPRLLLPLSGGPSSLALLHVLDTQLQRQREQRNRVAYDLTLLHIRTSPQPDAGQVSQWRNNVVDQFPQNDFLPIASLHDVLESDAEIEAVLRVVGISRESGDTNEVYLSKIFQRVKTPTARADMREILLQRLVVAFARTQGCDGILWGHSDSRLAAKALAAVATGRGAAVPSTIADGISPVGVVFHHPLRDLFQVELELYLKTTLKNFASLVMKVDPNETPVSVRQTSIDDLLNIYITSQGEKFPGIMANVVRTAGKLQVPAISTPACPLCLMSAKAKTSSLCYGCERMREDIATG